MGAHRGDSVYVVARNTEFEALFPRTQLAAATQVAIEHKATIENIPCSALCDQAVIDLFANA